MKEKILSSKKGFIKKVENFECSKCEREVIGNGYTNHCPHCLWSKHVDIDPGDREEKCGGMMKPAGYKKFGGKEQVIHQCQKCGFEKANKIEKGDNIEVLIEAY